MVGVLTSNPSAPGTGGVRKRLHRTLPEFSTVIVTLPLLFLRVPCWVALASVSAGHWDSQVSNSAFLSTPSYQVSWAPLPLCRTQTAAWFPTYHKCICAVLGTLVSSSLPQKTVQTPSVHPSRDKWPPVLSAPLCSLPSPCTDLLPQAVFTPKLTRNSQVYYSFCPLHISLLCPMPFFFH